MPVRLARSHTLSSALFFPVFLAFMFFAPAAPLWAQKDAGAIVGLVRDSSGAVVAGAKVTVTDVDRGIAVSLSTNDRGEYVASPLKIGRYTVTVEKQGFKKAVAEPVQVNIQDRVGVDLNLQPGMATEVVTVSSERPQLETETSELGQVVDAKRINALPLNGRNYAQLALLGVGVAAAEPGSRVETTYGFSANGARSLQNNFLLDGIDNNANLGDVLNGAAYVVQPAVDAIAEFKVETNSYTAEFGRGNGAIMNAVIKSGTNQIHGDLWEYLRNDKLDATNAFDIFGRQPYKQNQFGFTLGGPVIKNKMFFFGDYEGLRIRQALPQLSTVPRERFLLRCWRRVIRPTMADFAASPSGPPPAGSRLTSSRATVAPILRSIRWPRNWLICFPRLIALCRAATTWPIRNGAKPRTSLTFASTRRSAARTIFSPASAMATTRISFRHLSTMCSMAGAFRMARAIIRPRAWRRVRYTHFATT